VIFVREAATLHGCDEAGRARTVEGSVEQDSTGTMVASVLAAIGDELGILAGWLVEHRAGNLRELEGEVTRQGHRVLTRMLGVVLAARAGEVARDAAGCSECHGPVAWQRGRAKTLHLLLGDVPLVREYGACAGCGTGRAPLDEQLGVDQSGRSPRLTEVLALLGTELQFRPAVERLGQLCGVWLGASQAEAVTEGIGRVLAAQQDTAATAALAPKAAPVPVALTAKEAELPWLAIMLDGVFVPHRTGFHEVKVAALTRAGPALDPADGRRPRLGRWRYVVETASLERFGRLVWYQAQQLGADAAARVLVIADGAAWIWKLADFYFPAAQRLLDFWHAVQHLWALGAARFGEGDRRIPAWVGQAKARLARGQSAALLAGWERAAPADAAAFAQELTYFRNQAPRLGYGAARADGLPIGSGAVESANRHVVGVRAKQAGMRWTEPGLRGVLTLRALLRSGRWDTWWDSQPLPLKLAS
jgi:hypothetical protein